MTRKSFIITALVVNLTICITLCIVMFTGNVKNKSEEFTTKNIKVYSEQESTEEATTESETTSYEIHDLYDSETTNGGAEEESNVNEAQNQRDTAPIIYDANGNPISNTETTAATTNIAETTKKTTKNTETTTKQTTQAVTSAAVQNGTTNVTGGTVTVNGSPNIRSGPDTGASVVGNAASGSTYTVNEAACSSTWVAVYLADGSTGYIASSYCSRN